MRAYSSSTTVSNIFLALWLSFLYYLGMIVSFVGGIIVLIGMLLGAAWLVDKLNPDWFEGIMQNCCGLATMATMVLLGAQVRAFIVALRIKAYGVQVDTQSSFYKKLVNDVLCDIETKPFHRIYLLPDTSVAVMEVNVLPLLPFKRRVLILGWVLVKTCTIQQLRAVMAHERAHFDESAPFLHRQIYRIRTGIINYSKALDLEMVKDDGWNSFFLSIAVMFYAPFLRWYIEYLNSVTRTANHQAEYYCDMVSARRYSANVYLSTLRQAIFSQTAYANFVRTHERSLSETENLYPLFDGYLSELPDDFDEQFTELLKKSSDTHPSFRDREARLTRDEFKFKALDSSRSLSIAPETLNEFECTLTQLQKLMLKASSLN